MNNSFKINVDKYGSKSEPLKQKKTKIFLQNLLQ